MRASLAVDRGLESFCVALCHDLRGPIATAGAALDRLTQLEGPRVAAAPGALRSGEPSTKAGTELLEIARASLAKAEDLLSSLPALVGVERAASTVPVGLAEVVERAADDVRFELRAAGGTLVVERSLPSALGHREHLRIALRNLLQNSIRHRRSDTPVAIRIDARSEGRWRTLLVSDNGAGIAARDRAHLFEARQRSTTAPRSGFGLGLAIARAAIEASGGSIELRERAGYGATFAIKLRRARNGA